MSAVVFIANLASDIFYYVGVAVLAIGALMVIKVGLKFDINKWLERRDKRLATRMMNACPHWAVTGVRDEGIEVRCLYNSPFGTTQWFCQQCGHTISPAMLPDFKNPPRAKDIIAQQKTYLKLAKKAGIVP